MIPREEMSPFMAIPFPTYRESFGPGEPHIVVEADYDHGFYDDTPPTKCRKANTSFTATIATIHRTAASRPMPAVSVSCLWKI